MRNRSRERLENIRHGRGEKYFVYRGKDILSPEKPSILLISARKELESWELVSLVVRKKN